MNNSDYECFIALLAELVIQYRMKQKNNNAERRSIDIEELG